MSKSEISERRLTMTRKKASAPPKNDFASEEDIDIYSFTSEPIITGECISSFSFDDDSTNFNISSTNELICLGLLQLEKLMNLRAFILK